MDWKDQHLQGETHHHLEDIGTALNLPFNNFGDTLDAIFVSILEDLEVIHACNIVHRDGEWYNCVSCLLLRYCCAWCISAHFSLSF